MDELGLYLHVPFCLKKCAYCSFYSLPGRQNVDRYIASVTQQLRQYSYEERPLTSIFFGGGTPTMLPPESLRQLLTECRQQFFCAEDAEISIEVNPATVDLPALQTLRQAGFNRLSIGAQSFQDNELRCLGRPHTVAAAAQTVRLAREAGFTSIGLDLMFGLPEQTLSTWRNTLAQALDLEPQHLSIYELTIEDGTPFARQQKCGQLVLPDEDAALRMLEATQQMTEEAGFRRYEISNYALPGFECRHNINYWRSGEWIGLGPSAVSSINGTRCTALADAEKFCRRMESGQEVWQEKETLEPEAAFRESVVIGLRMTAGVSLADLRCRFGIDAEVYYGETLARLVRLNMLEIMKDHLRLTDQGLLLANAVMAELV
ncbi:radical SAM family heme chaperone HemW [Candidatus Electronema sp. TJ]|uniref:radical SAM family heme chaperone HemW n=1 Tax=Candidatus Electronema sp. TJ TaxID=3401573 RepID=UPI003AA7D3B3